MGCVLDAVKCVEACWIIGRQALNLRRSKARASCTAMRTARRAGAGDRVMRTLGGRIQLRCETEARQSVTSNRAGGCEGSAECDQDQTDGKRKRRERHQWCPLLPQDPECTHAPFHGAAIS